MKTANATIGLILLLTFSLSGLGSEGEEMTLKGEVVDLQCYMVHPENSTGPRHAKCAQACMKQGLPVGFLTTDGKLYLLLGPGHGSVTEQLMEKVGSEVSLKGKLVEQKGMLGFQLSSESGRHH